MAQAPHRSPHWAPTPVWATPPGRVFPRSPSPGRAFLRGGLWALSLSWGPRARPPWPHVAPGLGGQSPWPEAQPQQPCLTWTPGLCSRRAGDSPVGGQPGRLDSRAGGCVLALPGGVDTEHLLSWLSALEVAEERRLPPSPAGYQAGAQAPPWTGDSSGTCSGGWQGPQRGHLHDKWVPWRAAGQEAATFRRGPLPAGMPDRPPSLCRAPCTPPARGWAVLTSVSLSPLCPEACTPSHREPPGAPRPRPQSISSSVSRTSPRPRLGPALRPRVPPAGGSYAGRGDRKSGPTIGHRIQACAAGPALVGLCPSMFPAPNFWDGPKVARPGQAA